MTDGVTPRHGYRIQVVVHVKDRVIDSGHVSKASASTKAMATAQLSKETFKQHQVSSTVKLLWDAALQRARGGRRSRREAVSAR